MHKSKNTVKQGEQIKIKNGESILFIGDSITDCDRDYPVGMGIGLGDGYVSFVDSLLATLHPEEKIRILNTGISGNRIVDLEARWQTDVLDLSPDWLSVMIRIGELYLVWGMCGVKQKMKLLKISQSSLYW